MVAQETLGIILVRASGEQYPTSSLRGGVLYAQEFVVRDTNKEGEGFEPKSLVCKWFL
jgi:hypothetical protein